MAREVTESKLEVRPIEGQVETLRTWWSAHGSWTLACSLEFRPKSAEGVTTHGFHPPQSFGLDKRVGNMVITGPVRLYVISVPSSKEPSVSLFDDLVAMEALPGVQVELRRPRRPPPADDYSGPGPAD
jgi:hypothetical protein